MFIKNGIRYYTEDDFTFSKKSQEPEEKNIRLVKVFENQKSLNTFYWDPDTDIIYQQYHDTNYIKPKYKLEKLD